MSKFEITPDSVMSIIIILKDGRGFHKAIRVPELESDFYMPIDQVIKHYENIMEPVEDTEEVNSESSSEETSDEDELMIEEEDNPDMINCTCPRCKAFFQVEKDRFID